MRPPIRAIHAISLSAADPSVIPLILPAFNCNRAHFLANSPHLLNAFHKTDAFSHTFKSAAILILFARAMRKSYVNSHFSYCIFTPSVL